MRKKIEINKRDIAALALIATVVIIACLYVFFKVLQEYKFANQMENLYTKNESQIFSIDKIVMYSSANAIDNSKGQIMQDLNICQYTDIAIYIDNMVDIKSLAKEAAAMNASTVNNDDEATRELKEHSIKELYIDNIVIKPASTRGIKTLTYKNPNNFGKFRSSKVQPENTTENLDEEQSTNNTENNEQTNTEEPNATQSNTTEIDTQNTTAEEENLNDEINNIEQPSRIDFEVLSTNVDNEKSDYTKPTFYADCSNPIILNYLNRNVTTNYSVSTQDTKIKFDGSILQSVGIVLEDLECYISFDIHMKNNLDQQFVCGVEFNIPLKSENNSIYNGYMYVMQNELQNTFKFFKG